MVDLVESQFVLRGDLLRNPHHRLSIDRLLTQRNIVLDLFI